MAYKPMCKKLVPLGKALLVAGAAFGAILLRKVSSKILKLGLAPIGAGTEASCCVGHFCSVASAVVRRIAGTEDP